MPTRHEDLAKPVAWFRCGELEESYPEAYVAFEADFVCSIEHVQFAVDAEQNLYAFMSDGAEVYKWRSGAWLDTDET